MNQYTPRALTTGYKMGAQFGGKTLIAVPDMYKGSALRVNFEGESMTIPSVGSASLTFRIFPDKFGRNKEYTLFYYEWQPESKQAKLL